MSIVHPSLSLCRMYARVLLSMCTRVSKRRTASKRLMQEARHFSGHVPPDDLLESPPVKPVPRKLFLAAPAGHFQVLVSSWHLHSGRQRVCSSRHPEECLLSLLLSGLSSSSSLPPLCSKSEAGPTGPQDELQRHTAVVRTKLLPDNSGPRPFIHFFSLARSPQQD